MSLDRKTKFSVTVIDEETEQETRYSDNFIFIGIDRDECKAIASVSGYQESVDIFECLNALWQQIGTQIAMSQHDTKRMLTAVIAGETMGGLVVAADPSIWRVENIGGEGETNNRQAKGN